MRCPESQGSGKPTCAQDCPTCGGTGVWQLHRCPRALQARPWHDTLTMAVLMLDSGLLPETGGLLDQTAWFLDAVRFIAKEREEYRKRAEPNG